MDDGMMLALGTVGAVAAAGAVSRRRRGSFAVSPISCPQGSTLVKRRAYHRSDGTYVRGTSYCAEGSGRARGRTSPGAPFSRKKGYEPWITREGKLGGRGFLSRPFSEQKAILDRCVPEWGYRSCLGSIMVLERNRAVQAAHGKVLKRLRDYLVETYGGAGATKRWPGRGRRRRAA